MPYLDKDFKPSQYEYTNVNDYRRLLVYYPAKGGKRDTTPPPSPSITPSISITPTPSISVTPSITVTPTPSPSFEPPLKCCIYDVYTASTLNDACLDIGTTYTNFYSDSISCSNIAVNKMKDECGGAIIPDGIYFYQQGTPSVIYQTYNGDGSLQVVSCPSPTPTQTITPTPTPSLVVNYHIEAQNGDIIIAQNGDNIDWFPM